MKKQVLLTVVMLLAGSSLSTLVAHDECRDPTRVPTYKIGCLQTIKEFDQVLFLMQKRLAIMHEVARYKWNHGLPIDDPEREAQILNYCLARASSLGLPESSVEVFVKAQIDASKLVQIQDFQKWEMEGAETFEKVADLHQETRPYVDRLYDELIDALAIVYPKMTENEKGCLTVQSPLSKRYFDVFDEGVWDVAVWPLRSIFFMKPMYN